MKDPNFCKGSHTKKHIFGKGPKGSKSENIIRCKVCEAYPEEVERMKQLPRPVTKSNGER